MFKRIGVLVILTAAAAEPASAWDDVGHEVVAYMAWQRMTPETRSAVARLLTYAPPRSGLPDLFPPTASDGGLVHFVRASIWPDFVRDADHPERKELYHRDAWHNAYVFWEETAEGGVRVREDLETDAEDAVERLNRFEELARHPLVASAQKAVLIAWIAHLVGDVHQPLHVSARVTEREPRGDRGGRQFELEGDDNLHWYWDRALSEAFEREVDESELAFVRRVASSLMDQHPPPQNVGFDYAAWAERGFEVAARDAYEGIARGEEPPMAYAEMVQATAAERIALAGYRLAALMNSIFG